MVESFLLVILRGCFKALQNTLLLTSSCIFQILVFESYVCFDSRFTELSGVFEKNPGPKFKPHQNFSICYWSLNSIAAHIFLENPVSKC